MSLQLRLLNLWLRYVTRRRLQRLETPHAMRTGLARAAATLPTPDVDATFLPDGPGAPAPGPVGDRPPLQLVGAAAARAARAPRLLWTRTPCSDPSRVILYLHGGAYLAGSPETHRSITGPLADAAEAVVAAPDYRLAPENPFPAAVMDAVEAYATLLDRGWAGDRIALAGESAGGGLALATLYEIEQRGLPRPGAVVAFSPFADLALSGRSLQRFASRESMLPVERMPEAVDAYLAGADPRDPRASPIYAAFQAPPPVLIQAGRREALRDDAVRLAETLRRAGGEVRLELWPGAPHAFQFFSAILPEARRALTAAGAFIRARIPAGENAKARSFEGDGSREAC